jgi:predicted RNA-binding protein associated with RNAse of E/G family
LYDNVVNLYLDIIAFPDGSFYIKDEDELEDALRSRQIEEADYLLAKEAGVLSAGVDRFVLINLNMMKTQFDLQTQQKNHLRWWCACLLVTRRGFEPLLPP